MGNTSPVLRKNAPLLFVAFFGIIFICLLNLRVDPVNGPTYWKWQWRNLGFFHVASYLVFPFLLYCSSLYCIDRAKPALTLWLMALSNFMFQIFEILSEPNYSYKAIYLIATDPMITSYFTDALAIADLPNWLSHFHTLWLGSHSQTHPPGPILFYYLNIKLFGAYYGAYAGAMIIGLLGSLSVVFLYYFSSLWELNIRTRLMICAYYALIPSLILFFPEYDQVYPLLFMAAIFCWEKALTSNIRYLFLFSSVLFVSSFFAYNLLTMGTPIVLVSLYHVYKSENSMQSLKIVVRNAIMGLSLFMAMHLILYALTGYNGALSFLRALQNQANMHFAIPRPYFFTIFTDPYDFALGAGYLSIPLVVLYVINSRTKKALSDKQLAYSYIGLLSIIIINLTGLLRCETARVWLFLQPLLMIPVGIELARFKNWNQYVILLLLFIILLSVKANIGFVGSY